MNFICQPCRTAADNPITVNKEEIKMKRPHDNCKGGTWCDCQHRTGKATN